MNSTTKADKKVATLELDARTKKTIAQSAAALSESAGAWVVAQSDSARTPKTKRKTATVKVDAKTRKRLGGLRTALSELAGAWILASQQAARRR